MTTRRKCRVRIPTINWETGEVLRYRHARGECAGRYLAITRSDLGGDWTLTHRPTGWAVTKHWPLEKARTLARALRGFPEWNERDPLVLRTWPGLKARVTAMVKRHRKKAA